MKYLFVDTAGWMACADAADPVHRAACAARDRWLEREGLLLTTDYVIDETLSLIRFRLDLAASEQWWQSVADSPRDFLSLPRQGFFVHRLHELRAHARTAPAASPDHGRAFQAGRLSDAPRQVRERMRPESENLRGMFDESGVNDQSAASTLPSVSSAPSCRNLHRR